MPAVGLFGTTAGLSPTRKRPEPAPVPATCWHQGTAGQWKDLPMKRGLVLMVAGLFLLSGCASVKSWFGFDQEEEKFAQELAYDGMDEYNNGWYKKSIETFEKLKDWYPFSKYAILAELKIADAHYQLEQYEDAIYAYESFENLHPRNEAIPYVVYQIGMCHYEQLSTSDRDQMPAREAIETFQRLIQQHPDSPYASRAREHINLCLKSMAEAEFRVGVFYYKTKHYQGALERFKRVISRYPDVGIHQQAISYIAKCEASIAELDAEALED
jgi:outer membrane protein assembly factor BamD